MRPVFTLEISELSILADAQFYVYESEGAASDYDVAS